MRSYLFLPALLPAANKAIWKVRRRGARQLVIARGQYGLYRYADERPELPKNTAFFDQVRAKPQSMLKHAILRNYLATFATATGTNSPGNRVGYIDGYAGPGEYVHETTGLTSDGSPRIAIAEMRHQLEISPRRHLECVFIEKKPQYFSSLESLVDEAIREGLPARARKGDVRVHLQEALDSFSGLPVLVFLDPFGASLEHNSSIPAILNRQSTQPTELLLNFSVETLRRAGARIHEAEGVQGREANLATMDGWLGGPWWREYFLDPALVENDDAAYLAAERITDEYARRVKKQTGCDVFPVQIRRAATHKPLFRLMLFYPRSLAAYKYNGAVSLAQEKWREAMWAMDVDRAAIEVEKDPALGQRHIAQVMAAEKADKVQFKEETIETIVETIRETLRHQDSVSVQKEFPKVFGSAAGDGRELHLRAAWDRLTDERVTEPRDKSMKKLDKAVIRRPQNKFGPSF